MAVKHSATLVPESKRFTSASPVNRRCSVRLLAPYTSLFVKSTVKEREEDNSFFVYRRQLLESKLEPFGVVGYAFGGDILHGILEHLLVPHVSLHQMVKTSRLLHSGVELKTDGERERERETQITFSPHPPTFFSCSRVKRQATNTAPPRLKRSFLLHLALAAADK